MLATKWINVAVKSRPFFMLPRVWMVTPGEHLHCKCFVQVINMMSHGLNIVKILLGMIKMVPKVQLADFLQIMMSL